MLARRLILVFNIFLLGFLGGAKGERGEFSCLGEDNLLTVIQGVDVEEECRSLCSDTDGCVLYTWELYIKSESGYCLLYSHCELVVPGCPCQGCSQCISGVASTAGSCDIPTTPNEGSWQCTDASEICLGSLDHCSISCSLSCSPGYAPYPRSLSTCVGGSWSTEPSSLQCDETRCPHCHTAYFKVAGYWGL